MLLHTVCCQLSACPCEGLALLCIKVWMASVLGEAVSLVCITWLFHLLSLHLHIISSCHPH